jgi:dihydrofolate reductase
MTLSLIAAVAANGVIGADNGLPWRIPADLRFFKASTLGKTVVMGRRTFQSIGRALPGRRNVVLTRDPGFTAEGVEIVHDLDAALAGDGEVMLIGGAELYAQALPRADRLYLTEIDRPFEGDARFPEFDRSQWREVWREEHEQTEPMPLKFRFTRLERR